jgi:hypothetical protein
MYTKVKTVKKVEVQPRTGHECPQGGKGIALLFL